MNLNLLVFPLVLTSDASRVATKKINRLITPLYIPNRPTFTSVNRNQIHLTEKSNFEETMLIVTLISETIYLNYFCHLKLITAKGVSPRRARLSVLAKHVELLRNFTWLTSFFCFSPVDVLVCGENGKLCVGWLAGWWNGRKKLFSAAAVSSWKAPSRMCISE